MKNPARVCAGFVGLLSASMLACSGEITGAGTGQANAVNPSGAGEDAIAPPNPNCTGLACSFEQPSSPLPVSEAVTPLRRLTRQQLDRTLSDLLGLEVSLAAETLAPDERPGSFLSNPGAVDKLLISQHSELAAAVAELAPLATLLPCASTSADAACAAQFIAQFGRKAYRRPLSSDEQQAFEALFAEASQVAGFEAGVRLFLRTILQAPDFIYHVEIGGKKPDGTAIVPLSSHELAARLSYYLRGSMPDAELSQAADVGLSLEDIRAHATRLLESQESARQTDAFHLQWLGVDRFLEATKSTELFPDYSVEVAQDMLAEVARFTRNMIQAEEGSLTEMFLSNVSYPSELVLDTVYEQEPPAGFNDGDPVALDPSERAGLLTLPAFLAASVGAEETSISSRGALIRGGILCLDVPAPPADVNFERPQAGEEGAPDDATGRDLQNLHLSDEACASCHKLFDGIGFGLEAYDALGRYRTEEQGEPVNTEGELFGLSAELDGPFDGAVELAQRLATSELLRNCYTNKWFEFATGGPAAPSDALSVTAIKQAFAQTNYSVKELILAIALSDSFRSLPARAQ